MKYRINVAIEFDVDADSRVEAHAEAVNRLIETDLPGFDLVRLRKVVPYGTPGARERFGASGWAPAVGDFSLNTEPSLFPVGPEGAPHVVTNSGPELPVTTPYEKLKAFAESTHTAAFREADEEPDDE